MDLRDAMVTRDAVLVRVERSSAEQEELLRKELRTIARARRLRSISTPTLAPAGTPTASAGCCGTIAWLSALVTTETKPNRRQFAAGAYANYADLNADFGEKTASGQLPGPRSCT